jgi:hypothetical protein
MQTSTFRDWTLTELDKAFGLTTILESECSVLQAWKAKAAAIVLTDYQRQQLLDLQEPLQWAGKAWNEVELENKFISPLIMAAKIDNRKIGYFLERSLTGIVGNHELSGIVDGMIATGLREPDMPYFCMHEYKKAVDNRGNPDGQALAAMLVAREKNNNEKPIYGLYVVGSIWNFMVLNNNDTYCVSANYDGTNDQIYTIFQMMCALKEIIKTY